jgi:anti-sigma factor RsiW
MNCFEARQEFEGFWKRAIGPERRAEFSAHLKSCARCDHAFRVFALTAPVLHSAAEPESRRDAAPALRPASADRMRRAGAVMGIEPRRQWFAMCAAVTVFVAATLAAYLSVTAPVESLSESLTNPDATPDLFADQPTILKSHDLAG